MCRGGLTQHQYIQNQAALLVPYSQRDFAVSEKALALRIKAVRNIGKITKAMKMVAASKMRGDLERLNNGKHFGHGGIDMMMKCDPYMQGRAPDVPAEPRELLVPITSDKGLCGSINSGIFRSVRTYVTGRNRDKCRIFAIGGKGTMAMKRPFPDMLKSSIEEI